MVEQMCGVCAVDGIADVCVRAADGIADVIPCKN